MGTINVVRGSPFTLTVSAPGRGALQLRQARLWIVTLNGKTLFAPSPASTANGVVTFSGIVPDDALRTVANCGSCEWYEAGRYAVHLETLPGITNVIERGSVTFSGTLPCWDCGGEDPPAPDEPPSGGAGDSPYGSDDSWQPAVLQPIPPTDICLPTPFVVPSPPVPTPCGGGSGGTGQGGFSNPS